MSVESEKIEYDNNKLELQRQAGFGASDFSLLTRKIAELAANRTYSNDNVKTLQAIKLLKADIQVELNAINSLADEMIASLGIINA